MANVQVRARLPRLLVEDQVVVVSEDQARRQLAGGATLPQPGHAATSWKWAAVVSVLAIGAVGAVLAILMATIKDPAFGQGPAAAIEGLTIFAVFYVAAQAIERLLEPISKFVLPKEEKAEEAASKLSAATSAVNNWKTMLGVADATEEIENAEEALQAAADAKKELEQREMERTIAFWALATVIAMWASAALHLYFLRTVGITDADRWLEVLATGLILGAGTKPLHDLVTKISASAKKDEEDAAEEAV